MKPAFLLFVLFVLTMNMASSQVKMVNDSTVFRIPKELLGIKNSTDSSYGYTINNPIKVKRKDSLSTQQMIFDLCFWFKTVEGEEILLIQSDTKYIQKSKNQKRNRRAETIPIEEFLLETEQSSKPITLYFDTNTEDEIKIPIGLKIDTTSIIIPRNPKYRQIRTIR